MPDLKILVVDDEEAMRESMAAWLEKSGYRATMAENGAAALAILDSDPHDLILLDIKMPGMDGHELLERIKEHHPGSIIVMITAYGSIDSAITAMKQGASDYLRKPFNPRDLMALVDRLAKEKQMETSYRLARQRLASHETRGLGELLGCSDAMGSVFKQIREVGHTDSPVLITGETGTGKELAARAVHGHSLRNHGPFVAVNCGAIAQQLLESELFGHERGAFTNAVKTRIGRLEMADQGTLFLDEVGEISAPMQVSLLRALEEKSFIRVGGSCEVKSDFRLISATHTDVEMLLNSGQMRSDFFYRINVIPLHLPPLRERGDDTILLARHFLQRFAAEMGRPAEDFSPAAYGLLINHPWPGNVRELMNVVERAVMMAQGPLVEEKDLSFLQAGTDKSGTGSTLKEIEAEHIKRTLEECSWNISKAASVLDIDRGTLARHMKKHGIVKPK